MKLLTTLLIPTLYGFVMRLLFGWNTLLYFTEVMSVTFVVLVPLLTGVLAVGLADRGKIESRMYAFFFPWLVSLILLVVTMIASIEGWICWVMIYPLFAAMAGVGGLAMRSFRLNREKREESSDILDDDEELRGGKPLQISLLLLLPFIAAYAEQFSEIPPRVFEKYSYIDIDAPAANVWREVVRVREIQPEEDRGSLNRFMGIPRPLRAELDTLAVGGVREAMFSGGLVFHEKVLEYESEKRMRFSIDANPQEIPSTTMDKHIVIGGDYFDVMEGVYVLEELKPGHCRLHLTSSFALHTHFNWYAGPWAQWIMGDIQDNILGVIKERCGK